MRHREPETPPEAQSAETPAEERDGRRGGAGGFDWWAAPASRPRAGTAQEQAAEAGPGQAVPEQASPETDPVQVDPVQTAPVQEVPVQGVPVQEVPVQTAPEPQSGPEARVRSEAVRGVAEGVADPVRPVPGPRPEAPAREPRAAEVYRHVQAGEEFQEVRREYRRFVFPACAAFLAWYLAYIVAAVTLPGLMARQVAGPFTVAWVLGLLQFCSTFLIAWLYARHARDRRDRLALGLRWETQDRLR